MKKQAIIFDLDGTITDTEMIWTQATKSLLEHRGVIYTKEVQQQLRLALGGFALYNSCVYLKEEFNLADSIEVLMHEKRQRALEIYSQGIRFVEGFTDFIKQLDAFSLKKAIATNADDRTLEITNRALNLRQYFNEHIYGISCVNNRCKPDPAIYLHAANQIGIEPRHCIAIEDSAHGIKAARQAGMFCIGINTSKNPLQLQEAHIQIDHYAQIDLKKITRH